MSESEKKAPDLDLLDGISVKYEDRVVRIRSDENLIRFLHLDRKAGRRLAEQILTEYEAHFGKPLQISLGSLNAEIRIHVFADRLFAASEKFFTKIRIAPHFARLAHWLHVHTRVIDCGEKTVDNNRFVFDLFAPFCGGRKLVGTKRQTEQQ